MYQLRRRLTASCAGAMVAEMANMASAPRIILNFMLPSLDFVLVSGDRHVGRLLRHVPWNRDALDDLDHVIDGESDQAEQHDDRKHHWRFQIAIVLEQQVAESAG